MKYSYYIHKGNSGNNEAQLVVQYYTTSYMNIIILHNFSVTSLRQSLKKCVKTNPI